MYPCKDSESSLKQRDMSLGPGVVSRKREAATLLGAWFVLRMKTWQWHDFKDLFDLTFWNEEATKILIKTGQSKDRKFSV